MLYVSAKFGRPGMLALCLALCLGIMVAPFGRTPGVDAKEGSTKAQAGSAGAPHAAGTGIDGLPRLGLEGLFVHDDPLVMQAAAASGIKFVRVQLVWRLIEPLDTEPSTYVWWYYDDLFSRFAANGVVPLALVLDCPLWACSTDTGRINEGRYDDFGEFMGAVAERYSQPPYNLHFYEIWNEPDAAGGPTRQSGWGMFADKYVQMLHEAHTAVKAADPQSAIIGGGLAYDNFFNQGGPFNPEFLPNVLDNGGAQYMDAVAFHYYTNNAHGWTNIGLKTNAIRAVMNAHGVDLPLISTETGLTSSTNFGSSEAIQARYLVKMTAHGAAAGLRAQAWYSDRDHPNPLPLQEVFALSGLLRADNSPKPSHAAMKVLSEEIGSGAYLRSMGADDGVSGTLEGYRFRSPDGSRQVSVVWRNSAGQETLTISADQARDFSRAVDLYGRELSVTPMGDGTLQVAVGEDPVYLEWAVRYEDVSTGSWMHPYVEYLAARGIIGGYSDGTFRPGNPATRGQFSKMLTLGMAWSLVNPSMPHFRDVPASHSFFAHVETAFGRGIIGGYDCGGASEPCPGTYFRPGNNVTRAQIAKMVVLAKGWERLDPQTATFSDVPAGSSFYTYVETAAAHGIVSGYSGGTFRPGNSATRAQLSKMLALALQQP